MNLVPQTDFFQVPREPHEIIADALAYKPRAIYAGYSGGDDSLVSTHWMMNNVPGCRVLHINTGIGIELTRQHVRKTCAQYGWELIEVRAKEDCGQDYREMVLKHGFPGPAMHHRMYARLKERCVRKVVRESKVHRRDKVLIATGIHKEESLIRMGYGDRNINFVGAQMWVNHLYWWPKQRFREYIKEHGLPRSPVSVTLGMSGECLCGAYAHKGEKEMVRVVDPATAEYLDRLEEEVRAAGHNWGWEDGPPNSEKHGRDPSTMPMCRGCEKTQMLFEEAAE